MFAHKKIVKEKGAEPETFELDVAQVRAARRPRTGPLAGAASAGPSGCSSASQRRLRPA